MARKYQQGGFQARVQIDVEETGAPLVFWPDDFRGQLKALIQAGAATEHSALAWYRWKYADSCWQSVLFLPEEDIAIVELGAGNTAIVSSVNTPEEALRRLVSKNAMPNPTGCGCQGR